MNNIDINKYDDISYLSGLLFDVLYNKKMERKVSIGHVSISDINIDNIKKNYHGEQLKKLINNVFNRDITFIEKSGLKLIFKVNDIDNNVDLVLNIYNNEETGLYNIINMNKIMTYLFSDLVINKMTKHILMNVFNFDVNSSDIGRYIEKFTDDESILKIFHKKSNKVSIEIREHYFKMDTLFNILNDKNTEIDENMMKVIIFQVLHTLAVIQSKYPKFRHNNLDIKNIYCYLKEKNSNTYEYELDGYKYIIPNIGLELKITNFDESTIVGELDNESLIDTLKNADNKYDVNKFLHSLLKVNTLSSVVINLIKKMIKLNEKKINVMISENFNNFKVTSKLSEVSFATDSESSMKEFKKKLSLEDMDSEVSVGSNK
jgi:hypothetical protein